MGANEELRAQLQASNMRLNKLELSAEQDALVITKSLSQLEHNKEGIEEDLKQVQLEIVELNGELAEIMREAVRVSTFFREIIKKEHLKALEAKIDQWKLEEFVSKEEFSNMITRRLSNS